ncbi:MAG: VWA domain-containing protein [Acidobacteriia bacterium]|nr:VWA domain-containing protein [Terriglobia bacterium]
MKPTGKIVLPGLLLAALLLTPGVPNASAQNQPAPSGSGQAPQAPQQPQTGGVSISVEVPVVTLDVIAATQHGDILTGLKKENFRVTEDGVAQTVTNFGPTDAPITIVIVLEDSRTYGGWFSAYAKYWAEPFFHNLKQKDWVALVAFDMKSRVEVDFTQNKEEVRDAILHMYFPGFSESNIFDAVTDTLERLKDVQGKKSILIMASGVDTFSKHTLDQTLKLVKQTDVTIFSVGVGKNKIEEWDARGMIRPETRLSFYQAENQLRSFAEITGGRSWFPQFDGEIPGIFQDLVASLRNQYNLVYTPTNRTRDGKFRKIKVELVAPDGGPLTVVDQKGKKQKFVVYARQGYYAPKEAPIN